jgi:hypothetical protein
MKKTLLLFIVLFSLLCTGEINSQTSGDTVFIAFWNLENLFDIIDDPEKDDAEFLPGSDKDWTAERLEKKFYNKARVIRSMNEGNGPDIIGVCEVEHQHLLDTMVARFLPDKKYKTAYAESPDNRGIDNGLIFNSDKFSLISVVGDTVNLSDNYPTRLILNVNLLYNRKDTLRVFVNHWPSRRGGEIETDQNRVAAANVLRERINHYLLDDDNEYVIIIGDFNDMPNNNSVLNELGAQPFICDSDSPYTAINLSGFNLLNISYPVFNKGIGSYKYKDQWNLLDQIIISDAFVEGNYLSYICGTFDVYKPDIMVTKSGKYVGTPFPTFGSGNRYLGGYSDHYPVIAKFVFRKY